MTKILTEPTVNANGGKYYGGGKPKKYATPELFWEAAERYFALADAGKEQYTISGLALGLEFSSLRQLYDYAEYEGFEEVVERARLKVVHAYEKRLEKGQCVGAIFALKNIGQWRDERHVDMTSKGGPMQPQPVNVDFGKLSTAALGELFGAMQQTEKK